MKKAIPFVILCSLLSILWIFLIVCPSSEAQWYKPYGSCQWEGANVQRLTYNSSPNEVKGFYIDENDGLFLFYQKWWFDSLDWTYRETLFVMSKETDGEWSQPEMIGNPSYDDLVRYQGGIVGYDSDTRQIHIFYDCGDTLYYSNSEMPNWEVVKTDWGPDRAHVGSMAFDTLGNIHLVWNVDYCSTSCNWYKVMYANNSTGEWVKQQVSPPIWLGGMGSGPSYFAVQKNGAVHVVYHGDAYCDWECQAFYTRNDSLNSTNWITDTVPKPSRPLYGYNIGPMKVDVNDRVHLITGGCIAEDCVWPGLVRHFYYCKQAEESLWQGPETLPDTTFGSRAGITQLLVDEGGIPYATYGVNPGRVYFTDRKDEVWQEPYQILDTTFTYYAGGFCFVLDSEGQGHGAFAGALFEFQAQDDSLEIFYYGAPCTSVEDTLDGQTNLRFELSQNYPNPFNQNTVIR